MLEHAERNTGLQVSGVFGTQTTGSIMFKNRLIRSGIAPARADFQLLPQPRGALANLKPVALPNKPLKRGHIKVGVIVHDDVNSIEK